MNIVYFNNLYKPLGGGGAELLVSYLAEEIAQRGHTVTVITTCPREMRESGGYEVINNVRVIRIFPQNLYWAHDGKKHAPAAKIAWHIHDAWNVDAANQCRELLLSLKPDIVHTHNIDGFSPSIWHEIKKLGLPLIHTAHDCHQLCVKSTLLRSTGEICIKAPMVCRAYRTWYKNHASLVDAFCAPSAFTSSLFQLNGFRAKTFYVVRNGIPQQKPSRESQGSGEERGKGHPITFLYMGRLESSKGIQTLLAAFGSLAKDENVVLNIAGSGNLEGEILRAASQDARIRYHGYAMGESKDALLQDSDVLVFPSLGYETFGMGIIEAYSTGLPVIVSNQSAPPEIVSDGVTGLMFKPGDSSDLAEKMTLLARAPQQLHQMKIQALRMFQQFTVARMANDYSSIYDLWLNHSAGSESCGF